MSAKDLQTKNLKLVPQTREGARAQIERLQPADRAQVSPVWLARLEKSAEMDPWIHGFIVKHAASDNVVGQCGFTGPPNAEGAVEIAYGIAPEHQGRGYATEAAAALTQFAFEEERVRLVFAYTLPEPNASTRVLTKCGFQKVGEIVHPEDGLVWRWERRNDAASGH